MISKKEISIAIIIVIAVMFVSSSAIVTPLLAKSGHKDKTISVQKGYKDFQKCLTGTVGTKGYATKLEIRDCFNPIYSLSNTNQSNSSPSSLESSQTDPSNTGFSNSSPSGLESSQTDPSNTGFSNSSPSSLDDFLSE